MSMIPGMTYSPVASIVFFASLLIFEPISEILPPVIATSITASILFFGSITCPFLMSRSIGCAIANVHKTLRMRITTVDRGDLIEFIYDNTIFGRQIQLIGV